MGAAAAAAAVAVAVAVEIEVELAVGVELLTAVSVHAQSSVWGFLLKANVKPRLRPLLCLPEEGVAVVVVAVGCRARS